MISASYFDGTNGKRHDVDLYVTPETIDVTGPDVTRSLPRHAAHLGEPFEGTPCILRFADGSHCEIHQPACKEALQALLQYEKSLVQVWQDRWIGALIAVVAMLVAVFAAWRWGIPWIIERTAPRIPVTWEQRLGDEALAALDKRLLQPSTLTPERQAEARAIFESIRPHSTRMPLKLEFRNNPQIGPNALALPNGTIIVTDAMVYHIAGVGSALEGELAAELAGVLAHEIGHIERRHSMRRFVEASTSGVLWWTLFGDFSSLAAAAPTLLLSLEYSRAMETEADDYAADVLARHGISPAHLADLFESLERRHRRNAAAQLPAWMRKATDYIATHPAPDERAARLRRAAQQP